MDYADLGGRVRKQRHELGLTQQELADKVGVSTSFLGHVERGSRRASLETLVALANALDVSTDYLLAGSLDSVEAQAQDLLNSGKRMVIREILRTMQEHLSDWGEAKQEDDPS